MSEKKTESKTTKEKKLKGSQKIALERITRLFELAQENEKYSKRYIQLAKRIGEKCRVQVPKELREKACKKCGSLKVKQEKKSPFLIVICNECGTEKKYSLAKKLINTKML